MENLSDLDPHEAYLDAVFARIDRLRHIDAGILTSRYGVDPSVLDASVGEGVSWPASQVMADADAQREELREHLEGLQREYIAAGTDYGAAVLKAQNTLGDPEILAKQISRSTAQTVLGLDERWLPFLRRDNAHVCWLVLTCLTFLTLLEPLWSSQIVIMSACLAFSYASISEYAHGHCITPELHQQIENTVGDLQSMLSLPAIRRLNSRQRIERLNVGRTLSFLKRRLEMSGGVEHAKHWPLWRLVFDGFVVTLLMWGAASNIHDSHTGVIMWGIMLTLYTFSFARDVGIRLGMRKHSTRKSQRAL